MPSPLMRISLARPGACMAPKNMVLWPGFLAGAAADGGRASGMGLPQPPQKRWWGATSAPHEAQ